MEQKEIILKVKKIMTNLIYCKKVNVHLPGR